MCEPATIAIASMAAAGAGAAMSAYGSIQQGQAQSAAAAAKAQQDNSNAAMAQNAAKDALLRGNVAEQQAANKTAGMLSQQRVALAANGVDVNSGSAVDLQADTAGYGQLDQLTVHSNALREAAGYQQQGMNYQTQAGIDEASSKNAATAGYLGAGSSLLSGAGQVASSWYDFSYGTRRQTPSV